jgi:hypothetical protein
MRALILVGLLVMLATPAAAVPLSDHLRSDPDMIWMNPESMDITWHALTSTAVDYLYQWGGQRILSITKDGNFTVHTTVDEAMCVLWRFGNYGPYVTTPNFCRSLRESR